MALPRLTSFSLSYWRPHINRLLGGCLQTADLALLDVIQLLLPRQAHLLFKRILRVSAGPRRDAARFQFGDLVHDVIEQITIVRDDHHCAVIVVDGAFQKGFAVQIEMVVRLVEQQQARLRNQQLCQSHEFLLPAAEIGDLVVEVRFVQTQPAQRVTHALLVIQAAEFFVAFQQALLRFEGALQRLGVAIDRRIAQLVFDRRKSSSRACSSAEADSASSSAVLSGSSAGSCCK